MLIVFTLSSKFILLFIISLFLTLILISLHSMQSFILGIVSLFHLTLFFLILSYLSPYSIFILCDDLSSSCQDKSALDIAFIRSFINRKSAPRIRSRSFKFFVTIKFTHDPTILPFEVFRYIFWWVIPLIESLSSPVAVFSVIFAGSNFSPSFFAISYCIKEFAAPVSTKLLISSILLFSFLFLM